MIGWTEKCAGEAGIENRKSPRALEHIFNVVVVVFRDRFHHVAQAGLRLLSLRDAYLGLPNYWDYRREPPCLAPIFFFF